MVYEQDGPEPMIAWGEDGDGRVPDGDQPERALDRWATPDLHPDQVLAGEAAAAGAGEPMGPIRFITLHWTGAPPDATFPSYHFNIRGNGVCVGTLPVVTKGSHTWGRNSGNVGITLCAPGPGRVRRVQLETAAKTIAELAIDHHLDLAAKVEMPRRRTVGDQLLPAPGIVMVPVLTDHAFWAKADGYYPTRWDIDELLVPVKAKALWYLAALREGRHQFEHTRRG